MSSSPQTPDSARHRPQLAAHCTDAPGLYLLARKDARGAPRPFDAYGAFAFHGHGALYSVAIKDGVALHFEGLLTERESSESREDAALALDAWLRGGLAAIAQLRGYFNAVIFDGDRVFLTSDALCTRPWYFYRGAGSFAAAPTPLCFAGLGLPMTLNRQALFETVRMLHTVGDRTLVDPVRTSRFGVYLEVSPDGQVIEHEVRRFVQREDTTLTTADAAAMVKEIVGTALSGVVKHPRISGREIHLAITGGLDSRHILAELIEQGHTPHKLRHVDIKASESGVARALSEGLGIPLDCPPMDALDHRTLLSRWLARSGGLWNIHQWYLLDVGQRIPEGGAVGFDGHLMDWWLGLYLKKPLPPSGDPTFRIWTRSYSSPPLLPLLFRDFTTRIETGKGTLRQQLGAIDGEPWFQMLALDFLNRGSKFTGPAYQNLGDDLLCFAPGGHVGTLEYLQVAPMQTAGEKQARLEAFRRYFPEIGAYPGPGGENYLDMSTQRKKGGNVSKALKATLRAWTSGGRIDPQPESEHFWLRKVEPLHSMHARLARQSQLAADGHVFGPGLKTAWQAIQAGAGFGWPMMSLMTCEVAYRTLVLQQPYAEVLDWLLPQ